MLSIKEIRNKIFSTKSTNKITKTMEMISISKMKKIKIKMDNSFSYQKSILRVVNNVISSSLYSNNSYLINKDKIDTICIIVVSTNKGLCGSLNSNLFRKILKNMNKYSNKFIKLIIIGQKGINFFKSHYNNFIIKNFVLSEFSFFDSVLKILKYVIYLYENKKVQKFFLASNESKGSKNFVPKFFQLLPIYNKSKHKNIYKKFFWNYIYEPDNEILLNILFKKYLESTIYCNILENLYCEHVSRFFSMKQAYDNSENIIKNLRLSYNKCRQSNVTKELIEIVSGCSEIL
ncbi:ATP synthase F1 subunit gamma [Buchnera aphidicola (Ceratovacuna keduensis)]|uniref:ATP synthase F1 subunit gamma n=1 Tax=Buchnera aphidicola TaxID=9 RepID=UPI0031B8264B